MQASKADLVERLLEVEQECAQTQQQLARLQFALLEAQQAKAAQFVNAAWEARLALGEMELKSGNSKAGRIHLEGLQEEASSQGFLLMVQKAGMVLGRSENQAALRTQN